MRYQNFSLQGQPRDELISLEQIFIECRIHASSRVGLIGFKYFESNHLKNYQNKTDIPAYIADELYEVVDRVNVVNYTAAMTHPTEGLRMVIRSAKEIAFYEYVSNKTSNAVINILKELTPGINELEASRNACYDASPISMFPIVNFGEEHVKLGLRSPDHRTLQDGDMITVCYGLRGSLVARSGFAATGPSALPDEYGDVVEHFYKPYYQALVAWYETLRVGNLYGDSHEKVYSIIGDKDRFGLFLNVGHLISSDEWPNSPVYAGSEIPMLSGHYLQCDIIACSDYPFKQAILEDGLILADDSLRTALQREYPDVFARIQKRRRFMIDTLGINVHEDVLPLSNGQAVMHPYMLDLNTLFSIKE
ncbi:hypothetical protein SD71_03535 [Cohnella kolymensis]|uniref:Peptidase M24 domain-containing protein n=1 Tax=Cohnella kolymensis TaxID=1590652 RepID=A0ABR5AAR0_9BACL|nr:hypothetical protein SD71_03535 [Cohnella kolymensis]